MADDTSNSTGGRRPSLSRAEMDALSEIIAATIPLATRARSDAAAILLARALATLHGRVSAPGARGEARCWDPERS